MQTKGEYYHYKLRILVFQDVSIKNNNTYTYYTNNSPLQIFICFTNSKFKIKYISFNLDFFFLIHVSN